MTSTYHRANLALFLAGFVTFATLYAYQPLFPALVDEFAISPAAASLSLSLATLALAVTLPVSGSLSDALGRKAIMGLAVVLAPVLLMATSAPMPLKALLALRLLQGVALAGVPAVAMAYLADEAEPRRLSGAMGLYIAGNAVGGMSGRIGTAWLAGQFGWRAAVLYTGAVCVVLGIAFILLLPASRNFQRRPLRLWPLTRSLLGHLGNPGLRGLYLLAFTIMGGFVTLYNYVSFRLLGPEFGLGQTQVAFIFLAYAGGAMGSALMGALADRYGRGRVLLVSVGVMMAGVLLTWPAQLAAVIAGIAVFTVGFFGAHTLASSWVGAFAAGSRAQASSLYLFAYYMGSSLSGTGGGFVFARWEWSGVVALVLVLNVLALVIVGRLRIRNRA